MTLKKLLSVGLIATVAMGFSGCKYDDDDVWDAINSQEQRIAALEQWQQKTNTNIAALQAIVDSSDFIKSVTPITENGKVIGYTISFQRQGDIVIYHGEKGETGAQGAQGDKGDKGDQGDPGEMPVIGVEQLSDGLWYWTLNGQLLKDAEGNPICASGRDGKDGQDGAPGQNGTNGTDGKDGQDGAPGKDGQNAPLPELKYGSALGKDYIADAVYLSVDGGKTWVKVSGDNGKDGQNGAPGQDGTPGTPGSSATSIFSKAPEDMGSYWLFTLANGTEIKVAKYDLLMLTAVIDGKETAITGGELEVAANTAFTIKYELADTRTNVSIRVNDNEVSYEEGDGFIMFNGSLEKSTFRVVFVTTDFYNKTNIYTVKVCIVEEQGGEEEPALPDNSKKFVLSEVEKTEEPDEGLIKLFYNSLGQYIGYEGQLHFGWAYDTERITYSNDRITRKIWDEGTVTFNLSNGLITDFTSSSADPYYYSYDATNHLVNMHWKDSYETTLKWNGDLIVSANSYDEEEVFTYDLDSRMNLSAIIRCNAYLISDILEDEYPDIFAPLGYMGVVPEKPITSIGMKKIIYGGLDQNNCPTSLTIINTSYEEGDQYYRMTYNFKWTELK